MTDSRSAVNPRTKAARAPTTAARSLSPYRARTLLAQQGDPYPTRVAPIAFLIRPARTPATQLTLGLDPPPSDDTDAPEATCTTPQSLLTAAVTVEPTVATTFRLAMIAAGASQISSRGFRVPVTEHGLGLMNPALRRVLEILPHEIVYTPEAWQNEYRRQARVRAVNAALHRLPVTTPVALSITAEHPEQGPLARAGIVISASEHGLHLKLCTRPGGWLKGDSPVHKWSDAAIRDETPVHGDIAVELLAHARSDGLEIVDPQRIAARLEQVVRASTIARQVSGTRAGPAAGKAGSCPASPVAARRER